MSKKLPERWLGSQKAVRAVQIAFDTGDEVSTRIRVAASRNGISASDQIRLIVGLPISSRPKRPRLTVTLSEEDYKQLAKKYGLKRVDKVQIKSQVMEDIRNFRDS